MNRAIEIHDSISIAVVRRGSAVHVDLDASVHESTGRPGVDEGTGWTQPVRIVVDDGRSVRVEPIGPAALVERFPGSGSA